MGDRSETAQHLRQLARGELAGSTGAVAELREATGRRLAHGLSSGRDARCRGACLSLRSIGGGSRKGPVRGGRSRTLDDGLKFSPDQPSVRARSATIPFSAAPSALDSPRGGGLARADQGLPQGRSDALAGPKDTPDSEYDSLTAQERGQVRASEGSVRHVEVFQMGSLRTSPTRQPDHQTPACDRRRAGPTAPRPSPPHGGDTPPAARRPQPRRG
jgi:hypothetical protein